jgi:serine O-acetyltransferase
MFSLIQQVRSDLKTYNGDWLRPGFQALAFHRFGNWAKDLGSNPLRKPLVLTSKALFIFARNFYGIELPFEATIGKGVIIEHQGGIVIHGNTIIGNDCIIRQGVTMGIRSLDDVTAAPQLGNGVDVGCGAKILGSVKIGGQAKIGANAVVLEHVPPYATAIGVPAQVWNFRSHRPTGERI